MKKLNQAQREKVETARSLIIKLQEAEEIVYNNVISEIITNLDIDTDQGRAHDYLFDYLFNCSDEDSDLTQLVKQKIFE
jgi:hypothetical protein